MAIEIVKLLYKCKEVGDYQYKIDSSLPVKSGDWIIDLNNNLWFMAGYKEQRIPEWRKVQRV